MEEEFYRTKLIIRMEPGIFKRHYCVICGKKLRRKITILESVVKYKPFGIPFAKERKSHRTIVSPVYRCKNCDYMIEYDNQKIVNRLQKENNSIILINAKRLVKKYRVK